LFERYKYILNIALEAVFLNKVRSMLTALGIIFGVAAVIAMMAIGQGAKQEILDQMKVVGVNNIIITPKSAKTKDSEKKDESSATTSSSSNKQNLESYSPGLTMSDASSIRDMIPTVEKVCPEVVYETNIIKDGRHSSAKLTGVLPEYFSLFNLDLAQGEMFNQEQLRDGKPVCIIGQTIKSRFFPKENPIGKDIKCGFIWLKVIGILHPRDVSASTQDLGISDYNNTIFTPIQTLLRRYKDRSLVSTTDDNDRSYFGNREDLGESTEAAASKSQIDKIVVQVKESDQVAATTALLKRMLQRRHAGASDVEIRVPELLLKQQQRTKDIFNIVLGAIASISLIVGGIGIMNIMLASVMERIKEIGIRQAIGARKKDIALQFLSEATLLSITGGLIGIILGVIISKVIMQLTNILTIISPLSVFVSFGVSAAIGILFGYMPAKRASMQDPVASLRYE
jgi:putative ABC transport system permease protein